MSSIGTRASTPARSCHAAPAPCRAVRGARTRPQGALYVRISAHIYNAIEDYQRLALAVDDIVAHTSGGASNTTAGTSAAG